MRGAGAELMRGGGRADNLKSFFFWAEGGGGVVLARAMVGV